MDSADLDVIRAVPGFKIVLKAVLKNQIQQLVAQLAAYTDEESIVLTASVADGTLCHLGSDSAKAFLDDHEDVKSQFLSFCLKAHHTKKQKEQLEKETTEANAAIIATSHSWCSVQSASIPPVISDNRFMSHPQRKQHPLKMTGNHIHWPNARHEPYTIANTTVKRSMLRNCDNGSQGTRGNKYERHIIKIEPYSDEGTSSMSDTSFSGPDLYASNVQSSGQPSSPSQEQVTSQLKNASMNTEDSTQLTSIIPNESLPESLSLDSDLSNLVSGAISLGSTPQTPTSGSEFDQSVSVKVEDFSKSETDLEVTDVEPGRSTFSQHNWTPDASMGMYFNLPGVLSTDPTAATENQQDMQADHMGNKKPSCPVCGKTFMSKWNVTIHMRIHTGEKPFKCTYCGRTFNQKQHLKSHLVCHYHL